MRDWRRLFVHESSSGGTRAQRQLRTLGRKAPKSLYDPHMVSFEGSGGYNQSDAAGFIKLNALRLRVRAKINRGK